MRFLASLQEDRAAVFAAYLLTRGIEATVEQGDNGFSIWVHDDDKMAQAGTELEEFQSHPDDPRFTAATEEAEEIRDNAERHAERRRKNFIDVRTTQSRGAGNRFPLTILLIVLSGAITVISGFGKRPDVVNRLFFAQVHFTPDGQQIYRLRTDRPAEEIRQGQVWRLITPIFIHFDILHILFDMMWLFQLGAMIELRKGTGTLLILVLISAAISNTGQYFYEWEKHSAGAAMFGGMSGVVYALLGYIWMKQRYQPYEQLGVPHQTLVFMLVWLVLCMTGFVGDIANAAHFVGLLVGMAAGALPTLWKRAMK